MTTLLIIRSRNSHKSASRQKPKLNKQYFFLLFQAKTFKPEKYVTPGIRIKKLIRESNLDFRNQKMKQAQESHEENVVEDEFLKVARAGVKRNFLIKQKTINMGTLASIKEAKH